MDIEFNKVQKYLDWLKMKLFLDKNSESAKSRIVKRGHVYFCNFGRCIGSEQEKLRPCVVIQGYDGNVNSPNTIVAPITHTTSILDVVVPIKSQYDKNGKLILDGNVLLGNIVTVSKARLGDWITKLPKREMNLIDDALAKSIDIYWKFERLKKQLKNKEDYIQKLKLERKGLLEQIEELKKLSV